jgi:hypothetical protein
VSEYRVTECGPDEPDRWTDPECVRVITADGVREAAVRYCERVDPAWMLSKRRGDGEHIRRLTVYVLTPAGEALDAARNAIPIMPALEMARTAKP